MKKAEIIKRLNDILEVLEMDNKELLNKKAAEDDFYKRFTISEMYPYKCGFVQSKIKFLLEDIQKGRV